MGNFALFYFTFEEIMYAETDISLQLHLNGAQYIIMSSIFCSRKLFSFENRKIHFNSVGFCFLGQRQIE